MFDKVGQFWEEKFWAHNKYMCTLDKLHWSQIKWEKADGKALVTEIFEASKHLYQLTE